MAPIAISVNETDFELGDNNKTKQTSCFSWFSGRVRRSPCGAIMGAASMRLGPGTHSCAGRFLLSFLFSFVLYIIILIRIILILLLLIIISSRIIIAVCFFLIVVDVKAIELGRISSWRCRKCPHGVAAQLGLPRSTAWATSAWATLPLLLESIRATHWIQTER